MLIRGVVHHQIHHEFDAVLMCGRQQLVEIGHRTELGHNRPIIRNIVAIIVIRRSVNRGKPDNIYTQLRQIRNFFGDTGQIADAVAIGVVEGTRVNLVHNGLLPPLNFGFHGLSFHGIYIK